MIRLLAIPLAVAALAVSAGPAAAGSEEPAETVSFNYLKAGPPKPLKGVLDTGMFEHEWVKGATPPAFTITG